MHVTALDTAPAPFALPAKSLLRLMPHRYPMTLLDRIPALWVAENRVLALKHVAQSDPLLQGHFKDFPAFPPALVIEALAQASGLLMNVGYLVREFNVSPEQLTALETLSPEAFVPMSVLAESKIQHRRLVPPGSTLELDSRLALRRETVALFHVRATVDAEEIAQGQMLLAYPPYGTKHYVAHAEGA